MTSIPDDKLDSYVNQFEHLIAELKFGQKTEKERAYYLTPLINLILLGVEITQEQRGFLSLQYPKMLELFDYYINLPEMLRPKSFHVSLGVDPTLETVSTELLKIKDMIGKL